MPREDEPVYPPCSRVQIIAPLCLLFSRLALGAAPINCLQLDLYNPLNVDGDATTASTTLQLSNPNAGPVLYKLAIQKATARNTNQAADWVVAFYGADNRPAGPILEGTAAGHHSLAVKVDLSHLVEAGESTAELDCNGLSIGRLSVLKELGLPFRVSLDGNPAEKPEIEFVKGSPLDLRLRNDDSMHYPIAWEMFVKGKTVADNTLTGPHGTAKITVAPDDAWFSLYQSFFKSEAVDGTLTLGYKPKGAVGAYPSKTIPIRVRLNYYSPVARDIVSMAVILFILALGGLVSSYVNVDLVNRVKAISITKRIGELARITGEIGPQLNSQLRVSLLLERGRIAAMLPHRILFTPETAAALSQSDIDTDALKVRVDLAAQISDAIIRQDHAMDSSRVAPTLVEQVTKSLLDAQDLLKKSVLSAGELQKIQALVGSATNTLDRIEEPDVELEKAISARLQDLAGRFKTGLLAEPTCSTIKAQVPIPFRLLENGSEFDSQSDRDSNTRKLAIVAELVRMGSTDAGILECLERQDLASLRLAELLLRELKEGISLDDLRAEIMASPPRVQVTKDRDTVRVNAPTMLRLRFNKDRYNRAAARRRIECVWSFDHNNLTERGWEIHHYFPDMRKYCVKVTFMDMDHALIQTPTPIEFQVDVTAQRTEGYAHAAVEVQRWAVGFFVALLGLFAGAKDKIFSLDTASAIFAVFLLGFGIDMVKNLLVPKQRC